MVAAVGRVGVVIVVVVVVVATPGLADGKIDDVEQDAQTPGNDQQYTNDGGLTTTVRGDNARGLVRLTDVDRSSARHHGLLLRMHHDSRRLYRYTDTDHHVNFGLVAAVSVCLSVCLWLAAFPHYCTDPDVTWRNGRRCPLVVHYWTTRRPVDSSTVELNSPTS